MKSLLSEWQLILLKLCLFERKKSNAGGDEGNMQRERHAQNISEKSV